MTLRISLQFCLVKVAKKEQTKTVTAKTLDTQSQKFQLEQLLRTELEELLETLKQKV